MKGKIAIERLSSINVDDSICGTGAYYCKLLVNEKTTPMFGDMSGFH